MFFHTAKLPKLSFNHDTARMGCIHHPPGNGDVGVEIFMAGINHHGAVKAAFDAVITGCFITVVKVHREYGIRENFIRLFDNGFEHFLMAV